MFVAKLDISKSSMQALAAISHFRHQRRLANSWVVGDRRLSSATVAKLEHKNLVRELAFKGEPALVLTDEAKVMLSRNRQ